MLTILGPTASGKTALAAHLAYRLRGEIISADSRQIYRGMDIGTGKDLDDYFVEGYPVPYHLIDIREAGEKYNLYEYQHDSYAAYSDILRRGRLPILCGGTGLYIEAMLKGYRLSPVPQDKELRQRLAHVSLEELTDMLRKLKEQSGSAMHNTTDVDTAQRAIRAIEIETYNLKHPTDARAIPPIDADEGMVEEVKGLIDSGVHPDDLIYYGLEYKYLTLYVIGKLSYDEMFSQLEIAIHQFAKRQMTWFRGMERRGCVIHWIDASLSMEEKVERAIELARSNDLNIDRM